MHSIAVRQPHSIQEKYIETDLLHCCVQCRRCAMFSQLLAVIPRPRPDGRLVLWLYFILQVAEKCREVQVERCCEALPPDRGTFESTTVLWA